MRRSTIGLKGALKGALAAAAFAAALPAAPAAAQLYTTEPDFKAGAIEGSDPLVGLPVPGATPAEYRAHLLWNLRAGLNVAALQCQFAPFLRPVDNYNGLLAHHSGELAAAYTALTGYFKRLHGAKGQKMFDDYSTITYNNFAPVQGQIGFCQVGSNILKTALATPKGQLHALAQRRLRELRNSLVFVGERSFLTYNPYGIRLPGLPAQIADECWDKKNRLRKRCGGKA
jgi:hypothetical protein